MDPPDPSKNLSAIKRDCEPVGNIPDFGSSWPSLSSHEDGTKSETDLNSFLDQGGT